jgi:hypothetical protein
MLFLPDGFWRAAGPSAIAHSRSLPQLDVPTSAEGSTASQIMARWAQGARPLSVQKLRRVGWLTPQP